MQKSQVETDSHLIMQGFESMTLACSPDLNTAIIGGGIAGETLALALIQKGFLPTIFKKTKGFSPVGAGITLSRNAIFGLSKLGLALK